MKKLFIFTVLMALTALCAMAQIEPKIVRGVVIDNNGNPISGAEVMATGGGSSAITDADGSFSLQVSPYLKTLTATYAGMGTKKQKVKYDKDMVFRMKSAWKTRGFISLIGNLGFNTYLDDPQIIGSGGIMGGILGKWGAYGKFTYGKKEGIDDIMATAGLIKGCSKAFYIYLGIGYGSFYCKDYYRTYDSSGYQVELYNNGKIQGCAFDIGFIIKPSKHFTFSVGGNIASNFNREPKGGIDFGAGYVF